MNLTLPLDEYGIVKPCPICKGRWECTHTLEERGDGVPMTPEQEQASVPCAVCGIPTITTGTIYNYPPMCSAHGRLRLQSIHLRRLTSVITEHQHKTPEQLARIILKKRYGWER